MSTLHILYCAELPPALLRLWSDGDALLLAGAGVTLALQPAAALPQPCLALADAVQARGLTSRWPEDELPLLSPADWVALVARHDKSLSWS